MSENHNLQDDFKLITYKRKTKNRTAQISHNSRNDALDVDTALRRINAAKEDILSSDLHTSIVASLGEALRTLGNPKIKEIVCLGLGRIGECMISRYQLGLLLCLKDLYGIKIRVYDPVFTDDEVIVLGRLECDVLKRNLEGKYLVEDSTLFYLPHCPKQLSNNLLWANWGLRLTNCVVIANSFTKIVETHTKKLVGANADYVLRITPYALEFAVINTFKYFDIFNDTTIHVFPLDRLSLLSEDFWKYSCEPEYAVEDVEFVVKMATPSNVQLLRQIISELRQAVPASSLKDNLTLRYIFDQFRKHHTTGEQLCKSRDEMKFMASTYLCYLRSSRLQRKIQEEFHGKGERTVAETAKMVGFKLPHDPK